jgi:hypothetical protein
MRPTVVPKPASRSTTRRMHAVMFANIAGGRKSVYGSAAREQPVREVYELGPQ